MEYRAPDLFLGNIEFGTDLDLWSAGCVVAEIWLGGKILFNPHNQDTAKDVGIVCRGHVGLLGEPKGKARDWFAQLPLWSFWETNCPGLAGSPTKMSELTQDAKEFRAIPEQARDLVLQFLRWGPQERLKAESALRLPIFAPPPLLLRIQKVRGKHGLGSIASGKIQPDLLNYLQEDPAWQVLHAKAKSTHFDAHCRCMSAEEGLRLLKAEFPGYVDAQKPPKSLNLNSDANLKPIPPLRLRQFGKALRRRSQLWLNSLSEKIRFALGDAKLPVRDLPNGSLFLDEEFADNALVYASVQILKVGARDDGWHTDGGASLLHAGLTVFGSRYLDVDVGQGREGCISLYQEPGSFYIGNLCALDHDARHVENPVGCKGDGPDRVEIAVMFRSDVFREVRARKKNTCPGPKELFSLVNDETAKHLDAEPFFLPDLSEVLAESSDSRSASVASRSASVA